MDTKIVALAKHLNCDVDDIKTIKTRNNCYGYGAQEYLVLTDQEADSECADYIREMAWSFNVNFLKDHLVIKPIDSVLRALRKVQEELADGANDLMLTLIKDFDDFYSDAVSADGRGHFLAGYDGKEEEQEDFYIYRVN